MKSHMGFRLAYLDLTLTYSKGQLGRRIGATPNVVGFLFLLLTSRIWKFIAFVNKLNLVVYLDLRVWQSLLMLQRTIHLNGQSHNVPRNHTHAYISIHPYIFTCLHTHTYRNTLTHSHTNTHTCAHTCMHTYKVTYMYTHTHTWKIRHRGGGMTYYAWSSNHQPSPISPATREHRSIHLNHSIELSGLRTQDIQRIKQPLMTIELSDGGCRSVHHCQMGCYTVFIDISRMESVSHLPSPLPLQPSSHLISPHVYHPSLPSNRIPSNLSLPSSTPTFLVPHLALRISSLLSLKSHTISRSLPSSPQSFSACSIYQTSSSVCLSCQAMRRLLRQHCGVLSVRLVSDIWHMYKSIQFKNK